MKTTRRPNHRIAVLLAIIALLTAVPASAQEISLLNPRTSILPGGQTREINLMFGGVVGRRRDNLSLNYGQFWSPRVQVGTAVGLGGDGLSTLTTAGLFADYHFGPTEGSRRSLVPYAGAFGGYGTPGGRSSGTLGIQGGVKFFPIRPLAIRAELQHRRGFTGRTDTALVLGVSTFLP